MPADGLALYDEAVRRRIALERYSTAQAREALRLLKELEAEILAKIAKFEAAGRSLLTIRQQRELLASVKDVSADIYDRLQTSLRKGMTKLAGAEYKAAQEAIADAADSVGLTATTQNLTGTAALEIAAARPMQGALLKDWLDDLEPSHRSRIERALRISFAEGESLSSAARRLREAGLRNGRGLEALIRTSNAHIAAQVTQATIEANADIVEGVEWVAVLDSRTTDICRGRDGKIFPIDSGPRPPAHIGCRSTVRTILKGQEPAPRETYNQWLKRQPAAVQDDILGPARGKLFRSGKITLDRFSDAGGRRVPLAELGGAKAAPAFDFAKFGLPAELPAKAPARKAEFERALSSMSRGITAEEYEVAADYAGRAMQRGFVAKDSISYYREVWVDIGRGFNVRIPNNLRATPELPSDVSPTLAAAIEKTAARVGESSATIKSLASDMRGFVWETSETLSALEIDKTVSNILIRSAEKFARIKDGSLNYQQAAVLNMWTKGGNGPLQRELRSGRKAIVVERMSQRMDEALSAWNATAKGEQVTYRGVEKVWLDAFDKWRPGQTITLDSYQATSLNEKVTEVFSTKMAFLSPGVQTITIEYRGVGIGRNLDILSEFGGESEVLLPRGTKLRVIDRLEDAHPKDGIIDLRIIVEVLRE